MKKQSKKIIVLLVAIVLIFVGAMISYRIDTDNGNVIVQRISITDAKGYEVSAKLYIPKNARETPAPAMIISPGGDCPSDIASPWATEFSRRGYVVALADYAGVGDTDVNIEENYNASPTGTMELGTIYDYLKNSEFVDGDNIGIAGHSMGSLYSFRTALYNKVKICVTDVQFQDEVPTYDFNWISIIASHDEGISSRIGDVTNILSDPWFCMMYGTDRIEIGKEYGSWENNTQKIMYMYNMTHQDDQISAKLIRTLVDSVMKCMTAPKQISTDSLVYGWKPVGLFIAIIGLVMLLFALASLLIEEGPFQSLILKDANQDLEVGLPKKSPQWIACALLLTFLPVILFFPGTGLGAILLPPNIYRIGFMANGFLAWSIFCAIALIIFFAAYHHFYGKNHNGNYRSYGFATSNVGEKFSVSYVLKSFAFGFTIFMVAYLVLLLLFKYALTDLHVWVMSLRPLSKYRIGAFPVYYISFMPFFISLLLASGVLGRNRELENKSIGASILVSILSGMAGLILLFIVHEITMRTTHPFIQTNMAAFFMDILVSVIPEFGIAMGFSMYLKHKTNSYIPGLFFSIAIVTMGMICQNTLGPSFL
ncbi:MAG: hypothetical protein K5675_06480 [Lachnospiraceae bacterium]|nr:hypothetical protein [Lachnospiraceae bacterium]